MMLAGGITRKVLLIGDCAVKWPRMRYGWDKFLRGLLSNMSEARFSALSDKFALCPVKWAMWGGWLLIQQRCDPLSDEQWNEIEHMWEPGFADWNGFSCDFKRDNFGSLSGRIVLFDYGEMT